MQRIGRVSPDLAHAGLEADSVVSYLLPVDLPENAVVGSGVYEKALSVATETECRSRMSKR